MYGCDHEKTQPRKVSISALCETFSLEFKENQVLHAIKSLIAAVPAICLKIPLEKAPDCMKSLGYAT